MRVIKVGRQIPDVMDSFQSVLNFIGRHVIGREQELFALKICLLTGQHLLLEGLHGIAKSRFAVLAFKAFEDAKLFRLTCHGQTTTDDILGPPNVKELREKGIIRYNTAGMLPTADFAYLDELFRGPGSVLNCALNILNERVFTMGGAAVSCPLKTAVVTTNKVPEDDDLDALIDRFMIIRNVTPADSAGARDKILRAFLETESVEDIRFPEHLNLKDLLILQNAVRKVVLPQHFVSMLESVRTQHQSTTRRYLSDRRFCWAYRALQAATLLVSGGRLLKTPSEDALEVLADVFARSVSEHQSVTTLITSELALLRRSTAEDDELNEVETRIKKMIHIFDSGFSLLKKRKILKNAISAVSQMMAMSPESQYSAPNNVERFRQIIVDLNKFTQQVRDDVGPEIAASVERSLGGGETQSESVSDEEEVNQQQT